MARNLTTYQFFITGQPIEGGKGCCICSLRWSAQTPGEPEDGTAGELSKTPRVRIGLFLRFFLWRQTQLDESCLECGQVGFSLLTETQLEHPRLPEFAKLPTFFLPLHPVDLA